MVTCLPCEVRHLQGTAWRDSRCRFSFLPVLFGIGSLGGLGQWQSQEINISSRLSGLFS